MALDSSAAKGSRNAARRTRSDEPEGQPPRRRVRINAGQAIDRIRTVEREGRYDEAVLLCSQALFQDDLVDSSRMQLLLKRASLQCKARNTQDALRDARAAVTIAPNNADAYIGAAKAFHFAGYKEKAKKALRSAAELNRDRESVTGRIIQQLQLQWMSSKLPELGIDILLEILGYLDTVDLYSVMSTCKTLKNLLCSNASVWSQQVVLRGSLPKVAKQWKRLSSLVKLCEVHTLTMSIYSSPDRLRLQSTTIYSTFPFKTLTVFKYHSKDPGNLDFLMWHDLIVECKKLKVLRFISTSGVGFSPRLKSGDLLSSCRLEVFELAINAPKNTESVLPGESYISLVCRAKEIQIAAPLPFERIQDMIVASKDTVEIVKIDRKKINSVQEEAASKSSAAIALSKAKSLDLRWNDTKSMMDITAPLTQNLVLFIHHSVDVALLNSNMRSLLRSCASNLKEVDVMVDLGLAASILDGMLPRMQVCETLSVKLESGSTLSSLWSQEVLHSGIANDSSGSARTENQALLPKLRKLKIEGDTTIKGGELVAFIRLRQTLGLSIIDSLELTSCENIGSEAVAWLRRTIPHFLLESASKQRGR